MCARACVMYVYTRRENRIHKRQKKKYETIKRKGKWKKEKNEEDNEGTTYQKCSII